MSHPYSTGVQDYKKAARDFDYFATNALTTIPEGLSKITRARAIESANGFLVRRSTSTTVQAWFGKRPTGRPKLETLGTDTEDGAYLVYSLNALGLIAAILYPAKSESATAEEKYLVLGFFAPERLSDELEGHLRALVAYQYVTSIDGRPTLAERVKVRWLRLVCLREIDGKQSVATKAFLGWLAGMATRGVFAGIAGKAAFFVLVLLLIWFGFDDVAGYFAKRT